MILSDSSILEEIHLGGIEITPFNPKRLGSNSYDLTLGKKMAYYNSPILDAKLDNQLVYFDIPEDGFVVFPNKFYLGVTAEYTATDKYVPCIEGCSSVGRLGLAVHETAGFGDIGFKGHWTLEISSREPVRIYAGMPICQIYFMSLKGECLNPYNKKQNANYSGQPNIPIGSKIHKKLF